MTSWNLWRHQLYDVVTKFMTSSNSWHHQIYDDTKLWRHQIYDVIKFMMFVDFIDDVTKMMSSNYDVIKLWRHQWNRQLKLTFVTSLMTSWRHQWRHKRREIQNKAHADQVYPTTTTEVSSTNYTYKSQFSSKLTQLKVPKFHRTLYKSRVDNHYSAER